MIWRRMMLFSFQDLAMVVFPIVQVLHWHARTLGLNHVSFYSKQTDLKQQLLQRGFFQTSTYMGVSKNKGYPQNGVVYNGNPY